MKFSTWIVVGVFAWLAVSTFGVPPAIGLSWWPIWSQPVWTGEPVWSGPGHHPQGPSKVFAYPPALDQSSFAHVIWPSWRIAAGQLRHGVLPLWDPYTALGLPLAARWESQLFFPPAWPAVFGGLWMWTVLLIVGMIVAAIGVHRFLKSIRVNDPAAMAGAVLYMFSGYFLWFYTMPAFISEVVLLPWLFWAVEQSRQGEFPFPRSVGVCGLLIGLILLAGQPEIALLSLLAAGLYLVFAVALSYHPLAALRRLAGVFVGIPLGLGVAAVQMRLFDEAVRFGYTLHPPGSYGATAAHALSFTSAVWPYLLGQPQAPWAPLPGFVQEGFAMVLGATGLFLVCAAVVHLVTTAWQRGGAHNDAAAWSLLLVLCFTVLPLIPAGFFGRGVSWALGRADVLGLLWSHSAFLSRVNYPRYIVPVLSFAVAALAALGLHALERSTRRRIVAALALSLVVAARLVYPVLLAVVVKPGPINLPYMRASIGLAGVPFLVCLGLTAGIMLMTAKGRLDVPRAQTAVLLVLAAEVTLYVRYGLPLRDEYLRLIPFLAMAGCSILVCCRRYKVVAAMLLCVPLATAVIIYRAPFGLPRMQDPYYARMPAYVTFIGQRLQQRPWAGRILQTRPLLFPDIPSAMGIPEIEAYTPLQVGTTAWYILNALTDPIFGPPSFPRYTLPDQFWGMAADTAVPWPNYAARRRYYNLVGVRYIIDGATGWWSRHSMPRFVRIFDHGNVAIYEDEDAFPRAFAVDRVRVVPDLGAARQALLRSGVGLRKTAFVEAGRTPLPEALLRGPEDDLRPVRVAAYEAVRVVLDVTAPRSELVVQTDAFYPGWTARVDGRPSEIYRVDSIVRGIAVPPGHHRIVLRYHPVHLRTWLGVSGGSMAVSIMLIALNSIPALAHRRRPAPEAVRPATGHPSGA